MVEEAPRLLPSTGGGDGKSEPNEQILLLMQNLGIDSGNTREVCSIALLTVSIIAFSLIETLIINISHFSPFVANITITTEQFTIYS